MAGHADVVALQRRRALRDSGGKLIILNLFLIGIWAAAGAGYFWPAWVMLGSVVLLALKLLHRSHSWLERLQDAS
jgi:hypothetical protein